MTRVLKLTEAANHSGVRLAANEARWLHDCGIAVVIPGRESGTYDLRVNNVVGTMASGGLHVSIRPKLPVEATMRLLSISGIDAGWRNDIAMLGSSDVVEVIATLFLREVDALLRRGLSRGYRDVASTDVVLRGRLRLHEQIGRRFGELYPLEIQYEEFDRNTPANRTLLTALLWLEELLLAGGHPVATDVARRVPRFVGIDPYLRGMERPQIRVTRLDAHYSGALSIAELILEGMSLSELHGLNSGRGILFRMWEVFERFVARVLADQATGETVDAQFTTGLLQRGDDSFRIRPDIVIRSASEISAVIDTKYKSPHPTTDDLYQVNAYAGVLGVRDVTLLYAEPVLPRTLTIAGNGVRVHLRGIDLTGSSDEIIRDVLEACRGDEAVNGDQSSPGES